MKRNIAGGEDNKLRKDNLEQYRALAASDRTIVAFATNKHETLARFYTYLEGTTSRMGGSSWPVYVCEDLIEPIWGVGSEIQLGNFNVVAPSPIGKYG